MQVKDLIRETIWTPGSNYAEACKPAVSVLLPTFRGGASGLFRKAARSVLDQTLRDLELIIIDDASTDGTAEQIAELMQEDGRVSCLRHPRNIGLPAVSEYEAYLKARADYIAFAFDDDAFNPDALERLLAHSLASPGCVCFGHVLASTEHRGQYHRLGQSLQFMNIRSWNTIPNCAVLLPRSVIEDVGFYDPHIMMTRICDWDLWRRVNERYALKFVDVDVGEVTGPATEDSLGKSYTLTLGASEEWMRTFPRRLRPQEIGDLDVFASSTFLSARTQSTISELVVSHAARRPWMLPSGGTQDPGADKWIFVLTQSHDASVSLCFDYLPRSMHQRVRIIITSGGPPLTELVYASCVIVIRRFARSSNWIDAAHRLGIPLYYFLDDNFPELIAQEGLDLNEDLSAEGLRSKLTNFAGVLVSSEALADYVRMHLIHSCVFFFPVSYAVAPPKLPTVSGEERYDLTIASVGGKHRFDELRSSVLPAVRALARPGYKLHFIVAGCNPDDMDLFSNLVGENENLKVTLLPFNVDWSGALRDVAQFPPDVLVHAPSRSVNAKYKTLNIALCAHILDAVLVAADGPPFSSKDFEGCAVLVSPWDRSEAWLAALQTIVDKRADTRGIRAKNARYCQENFSGETNIKVLNAILAPASRITPTVVEARLKELHYLKSHSVPAASLALPRASTPDLGPLRSSLSLLAAVRRRARRARFRWRRANDLWPHVSPVFEDVRRYVIEHDMYDSGTRLELSDTINDRPFVEYPLRVSAGTLGRITCAFSSEGMHDGQIGVEIVDEHGTIVFHTTRELTSLNLHAPVEFDLRGLAVPADGVWRLRLFARSTWPIYVYELVRYSHFGQVRRPLAPFAKVELFRRQPSGDASRRAGALRD